MASDTMAAETRQQHVQTVLERLLSNSPIYGFTLSTLQIASVSRGAVTTKLRLTETHLNSKGGLHGAVSATIVDLTTGLAIASWDLRDTTGASVDMQLSFLSSARAGDVLRVETVAERVGGSLAFVTIRMVREAGGDGREEAVVTLGQHTKYVKGTAKPE